MPRYFCDYCDVYLTHDSAPGRKQHIRGWKHRENVKQYYEQYMRQYYDQNPYLPSAVMGPRIMPGQMLSIMPPRPPPGAPPGGMPRLPPAPGSVPPPPGSVPPPPPRPPGSVPPPGHPGGVPGMYPPMYPPPLPPRANGLAPPPAGQTPAMMS
ncbi:hypothetical protein CTAYLR_001941 [Chrysophaeum taylorii]|uniref:U1 small nuclear ribonucleoprotein C n=1 Tax=Chrysophaeum taylorii TaxID=2483200 RepID=A0AAD7U8H9_9STRA|nr:hypothetical protein CTAYLR_001941 [Chrysophaeum taylorii]